MELRAAEDTAMAIDLTPPLVPLATALHHRFLRRHCSSCFVSLSSSNRLSCRTCDSSVLYCSARCYVADSPRHVSTGECFILGGRFSSSSDLRAALRLIHLLDRRAITNELPRRIAGISAGCLDVALSEGGETAVMLTELAALMKRATDSSGEVDLTEEVAMAALWAVITNAVEVEVGKVGTIGIAVYGPQFSWANHSCLPNASYRFEQANYWECAINRDELRVFPSGSLDADIMQNLWWYNQEIKSCNEKRNYGPRIILRSIKPINKGEEVVITYIDLMHPTDVRHAELWSKYRFICCCNRCRASPAMYIDYLLTCNELSSGFRISDSEKSFACDDVNVLADYVEEAIEYYITYDDPVACCNKLEALLSPIFQNDPSETGKILQVQFKLHPVHHLSLKAYITLTSSYRASASNLLANNKGEEKFENLKMWRAAAAYSVFLAAVTHCLFRSEPSLIANAALHWITAGESLLDLVRSLIHDLSKETIDSCFNLASDFSQSTVVFGSCKELETTSIRYVENIFISISNIWPFLAQGLPYLESIGNPAHLKWVELGNGVLKFSEAVTVVANYQRHTILEEQYVKNCNDEQVNGIVELSVLCLTYGTCLASICYSPSCPLVSRAKEVANAFQHSCQQMMLG